MSGFVLHPEAYTDLEEIWEFIELLASTPPILYAKVLVLEPVSVLLLEPSVHPVDVFLPQVKHHDVFPHKEFLVFCGHGSDIAILRDNEAYSIRVLRTKSHHRSVPHPEMRGLQGNEVFVGWIASAGLEDLLWVILNHYLRPKAVDL